MAKKKPPPKTLRRPEAALSGVGVGSLLRIVLLASLGIAGAIVALWVHYRKPLSGALPSASSAAPNVGSVSSDGVRYIDIDMDASVLP